MVEQCRLFLRSGNRDAEFLFNIHAERRPCEISQNLFDFLDRNPLSLNVAQRARLFAFMEKLHGAHAVPTDLLQKAVCVSSLCTGPLSNPSADIGIVGEQVVEDSGHGCAGISRGP